MECGKLSVSRMEGKRHPHHFSLFFVFPSPFETKFTNCFYSFFSLIVYFSPLYHPTTPHLHIITTKPPSAFLGLTLSARSKQHNILKTTINHNNHLIYIWHNVIGICLSDASDQPNNTLAQQQLLGNGSCGTDVRVRNHKLHCNNCYSNDEAGLKFSRV